VPRSLDLRVAGLLLVAVLAYWPTSSALWHFWVDHPYWGAHGILVAALAAWLVYRARPRLAATAVRPLPWVLIPLVLASIALLYFSRIGAQGLQLLMLPTLMLLGLLAAFGASAARVLAIPVGFLYFGMPVWNLLAEPLRSLTLAVCRLVAPLIGLPASFAGPIVTLPGGITFEVTIWCSGLGFFVQGLAVATLLGELELASRARRLALLASMALVALITNWVRVLIIIQVGYATNMRHVLVTTHHLLFGYALFGVVLVAYVWIVTRLAPQPAGHSAPAVVAARPAGEGAYVATLVALVIAPLIAGVLALLR
jgi:exosortase